MDKGVKVARFSIATTESYNDKNTGQRVDQTEWHNITLWRGLAEVAERYLHKGSQIYLEGKLQTRSYQDKDGVTKYSTEIVGQTLNMLGSRQSSQESQGSAPQASSQAASPASSPSAQPAQPAQQNEQVDSPDDTDDLPF